MVSLLILKFLYLCNMNPKLSDSSESRLKNHDYLEPFMEYLESNCMDIPVGKSLTVYRTQASVPVDESGQVPRALMNADMGKGIPRKYTKEEVDKLSEGKIKKEVGKWGLSCNSSEEQAEESFIFTYDKLAKNGSTPEELEAFVRKRGDKICRYMITNEIGKFSGFDDNGHGNLYLYENVDLEDCRDKTYEPRIINYKKHNGDE